MVKVKNRAVIRRLSSRSMRASKNRNLIAIAAIMLTAILFTTLFTIAITLGNSFQESNFRQVGGNSHGGFKYLNWEQVEELKDHELIKSYGLRQILGMASGEEFTKTHVEIGYSDKNQADRMFCRPQKGKLPKEGTNEAATDTRVLELLGVTPEIGAEFTISFDLSFGTSNPKTVTRTFVLSGWWEYDPAIVASHVIIPQSAADEILDGYERVDENDMTGTWGLDVMLPSSANIEENVLKILEDNGYQGEDKALDNYIAIGVNWGYVMAQVDDADPITTVAIIAILIIIILTGYLIIYNVFQISVYNDIRYYGLLKTIGTTGRQIKRIIRIQALLLSAVGIPLGLLLGWFAGKLLLPVILKNLSIGAVTISASPLIFVFAAVFSIITVFISCRRPGRVASRVSPIEAIRYTEGDKIKKSEKSGKSGGSVHRMALANLGRSKGKTVVTVISLSLAVVLLNMTYTFTQGFDMDKYIERSFVSDFIFGSSHYFNVASSEFYSPVPEELVDVISSQEGVENTGRVYGCYFNAEQFVTEDQYREFYDYGGATDAELVEEMLEEADRDDMGRVPVSALPYGMDDFALGMLDVVEGDLSPVYEDDSGKIAAVCLTDDYGNVIEDSNWAKIGDKVRLRGFRWEYYDTATGEVVDSPEAVSTESIAMRRVYYGEREYTVCARVTVKLGMSYRFSGSDQFVLSTYNLKNDLGVADLVNVLVDVSDDAVESMEGFFADFTGNSPDYDYESRSSYAAEFESFRGMFVTLGGALSGIIGLVGILNFINAVITGINTRRREFAMLQAIGMTGKQLKAMLVWEGIGYGVMSIAVSLMFSLLSSVVIKSGLEQVFWFFSYNFTILPVLIMAPVFLLLGVCLPLIAYRFNVKRSVVERLRDVE